MTISSMMTRLWTAHVIWTRQVIVSTLASLPDAQTAIARLLQNQQDIGSAFGQFYGGAFGAAVAQLFTEHIQISLKLVSAAAAGNTAEASRQDDLWHQNSTQIAALLGSANHYWPVLDIQAMMFDHLKRTKAEATARIQQNWIADVAAFDGVLQQALHMADMFTSGICAQFGTTSCDASCRCAG